MSHTAAENNLIVEKVAIPIDRFQIILSRLIAALLIFAAIAKGYEFWRVPSTSPALQVGSELSLAIWLLTERQFRWAQRVTLGVFSIYSLVTLWKIFQGVDSCGCFGPIIVPPVFTFALDAAIVILLILTASFRTAVKMIVAVAFVSIATIALQIARWHGAAVVAATAPPSSSIPSTRPATTLPATQSAKQFDAIAKPDSTTQWTADLGQTTAGQTVHILFPLTNPSDHILAIRGVNVSCGCTSVPQPPPSIAKDGKTNVEVIVRVLDHSGPWESTVSLTTDVPTLPPLALIVKGRVP